MKYLPRFLLLTGVFLASSVPSVTASSGGADSVPLKKWSFGATYSGVGLGYRFSPRWSTELRAQALEDVFVAGTRLNFYFKPRWGLLPYAGIEADYTTFEGVSTDGTGYAAEAFIGAEYYFGPSWSAVLDAGPAWISVEDDDTGLDADGVEGVINIGINYHFGKAVRS